MLGSVFMVCSGHFLDEVFYGLMYPFSNDGELISRRGFFAVLPFLLGM